MKLENILCEVRKGITEAGIEYYTHGGYLRVKFSQWSIMRSTDFSLEQFWKQKSKEELVNQFIKATYSIAKRYGLNKPYTFEGFQDIVDALFYKSKRDLDILFDFEPGFDFKGLYKEDRFSIEKIAHDEEEAKTAKWAQKERGELSKLNNKND
jgi:hypothetical protein